MRKIPFNEKELTCVARKPDIFGGPDTLLFDTPVSSRENFRACLENDACWIPTVGEITQIYADVIPDNVARGPKGGPDMFGVEWEYVEVAEGSMVKPGNPMLTDVNDWKRVIRFPDVDAWDWDGCKKLHGEEIDNSTGPVEPCIMTGWFERLISFMDFENAAVALVDPEQQEAVLELLDHVSDVYIKIIDKFLECFPGKIDGFTLHDDWGGQRSPFFSENTVRKMLLPAIRKVNDHCHKRGLYTSHHCCGKIDTLIPCTIEAGFDCLEPMDIVDTGAAYEKYGDVLKIQINPKAPDINAPDEEQKACAEAFVGQYVEKGKGCIVINWYTPLSEVFQRELYRLSRMKLSQ